MFPLCSTRTSEYTFLEKNLWRRPENGAQPRKGTHTKMMIMIMMMVIITIMIIIIVTFIMIMLLNGFNPHLMEASNLIAIIIATNSDNHSSNPPLLYTCLPGPTHNVESSRFTRCTRCIPQQCKWQNNTIGLHCRISRSRAILNGFTLPYNVEFANSLFSNPTLTFYVNLKATSSTVATAVNSLTRDQCLSNSKVASRSWIAINIYYLIRVIIG